MPQSKSLGQKKKFHFLLFSLCHVDHIMPTIKPHSAENTGAYHPYSKFKFAFKFKFAYGTSIYNLHTMISKVIWMKIIAILYAVKHAINFTY